jgi:hypothetical protein
MHRLLRRHPAAALGALLACAVLAACDGSNAFRNPVGTDGQGGTDTSAPTVDILLPVASATALVGDSLFVQVHVKDDVSLASLEISGFAVRGSPALGTAEKVARFATKTVDLNAATRSVRDTTVGRYLVATADTLPETTVYVVALATDSAGNQKADTAVVSIQGRNVQKPTVSIQLPLDSATMAVGDSLFAQVRVTDGVGIATVTFEAYALRGDAALGTQTQVQRFASKTVTLTGLGHAVRDTVLTRYLLALADSTPEHAIRLVVTATNTSGQSAADTAGVNIGGPRVSITSPAQGSSATAGNIVTVRVSASDPFDLITSVRVRASGAFTKDTTLTLPVPRASVDTAFQLAIPAGASGAAQIDAYTTSGARIESQARPVGITISASSQDHTAPRATFSVTTQAREEPTDSFTVAVTGVDETAVDSTGVTVKMTFRNAVGHDTTVTATRRSGGSTATYRFALSALAISPLDTATMRLDVTAFAKDHAGNCGAAVSPNTPQSLPCTFSAAGDVNAGGPGAQVVFQIVRGQTVASTTGDLFVDLASDGTRLFVSNFNRNRVELLPIRGSAFSTAISVGSQPWGLAVGRAGDSLYVANSGGTNISVVALAPATPTETRRIRTPDVNLYDVSYDVLADTVSRVTPLDYSDRPQYLGQISSGQLIYSTKPTATRADGTVRIYDPAKDTSVVFNRGPEVYTRYASSVKGKAIGVNAVSVTQLTGGRIQVCPRRVTSTGSDPACITGLVSVVSDQLAALEAAGVTDTRLDLAADAASIGLSDTTFIAVSTDHSTIAFGEGVRDPGRILRFAVVAGTLVGSTRETSDLVGNAAERVIGLGLNADGSLGVARGSQVYFFDSSLRQQGVVISGAPSGGVALHPQNANYPAADGFRVGFASGLDSNGAPYVDVIDSYSFRALHRIYTRDTITGALIAVPVTASDPDFGTVALRLFALTSRGVLRIDLRASDMQ